MKNRGRSDSWQLLVPLAAVTAVYVWYFFLPRMTAIREVRQQLDTKQQFIAQSVKMRPALDAAVAELRRTNAYCELWSGRNIERTQMAALYGRISQVAKDSGAVTSRFEPVAALDYESFQKGPVVFAVSGSFAAVEQLILGLETLPQNIWVEDVKLQSPREAGQDVKCELNLAIFINKAEKSD
jgi:Tfp pilus assembly protein PilO